MSRRSRAAGFATLEEVEERIAERARRHAARPWPLRRGIDGWWQLRRTLRDLRSVPPWARLRWRWQRSRRGWSERDVWNMHGYLAPLIAGMAIHLRDHGHTWPGGELTVEAWHAILTDIAGPLAVDLDRDIDGETREEYKVRVEAEYAAQRDALRLMAAWFGHLWD